MVMTGQDLIDLIKENHAENMCVFVSMTLDDGRVLNWDTDVQLRTEVKAVRDEDCVNVYTNQLHIEAFELPF